MTASKFTDAQTAFIIQQRKNGTPIDETCRMARINTATFYALKA